LAADSRKKNRHGDEQKGSLFRDPRLYLSFCQPLQNNQGMDTNSASADTSTGSGNEDPGKVESQRSLPEETEQSSAYKKLALLDRFLALWILLAMAVGIILGNFVPNTGPALQKGKFVGVSIPIGKCLTAVDNWSLLTGSSGRFASYDVSNPL
jgi:hypothetical protein